ncbi:MAG: hypothetical protein ABI901_18415, partial [Roseiflexaceae bacterium]
RGRADRWRDDSHLGQGVQPSERGYAAVAVDLPHWPCRHGIDCSVAQIDQIDEESIYRTLNKQ